MVIEPVIFTSNKCPWSNCCRNGLGKTNLDHHGFHHDRPVQGGHHDL